MGKAFYQKRVEELFMKSAVVSYASIERIIRDRKKRSDYAKQLIRNLIHKGTIQPLMKGFYTSRNEASLLVFCLQPAYLGLQDAMSFHQLWEQETVPVVVTTRCVRQGVRSALGTNVLVRRIKKEYCFGFEYAAVGDVYLPYSDFEKTFIDMAYFKESLSAEVLQNFKDRVDRKKLKKHLKRYPQRLRDTVWKLLGDVRNT